MPTRDTLLPAAPGEVYRLLVDPDRIPTWLVGAQRIRGIDADYPATGSCFHHVIGVWPFRIRGSTCVITADPGRELTLRAGMGFLGAARVRFVLHPEEGGTRLVFAEEPERGAIGRFWRMARLPLALVLIGRNRISLDRLRDELVGVSGGAGG